MESMQPEATVAPPEVAPVLVAVVEVVVVDAKLLLLPLYGTQVG